MNTALVRKAIEEIEWADVEGLLGTVESALLEFKATLPQKEGNRDPWLVGGSSIGRYARDQIAHEICAFANAYGGTLVLGVQDDHERPAKATALVPLPRCILLAELLEQQLRSELVDPPLGGLQVRAVMPTNDTDAGVIVIRVSASAAAPHGVGTPPAAFVRRGSSCMPMSMRELQSAFWEARTMRERISSIRQKHSAKLATLWHQISMQGIPAGRRRTSGEHFHPGAAFRISVIPHQSLNIGPLNARSAWLEHLCPDHQDVLGIDVHSAFDRAGRYYGWTSRAHGVISEQDGPSTWTIMDDGTVSLLGFAPATHIDLNDRPPTLCPEHFAATGAMVLAMSERLRRRSGRSDVPLEVDCQLLIHNGVLGDFGSPHHRPPPPEPEVEIGPFLISTRASIADIFHEMQREIWAGFAVSVVRDVGADFDAAFKPGPWSVEH